MAETIGKVAAAVAKFVFGGPVDCVYSLPERGQVTAKKDKQGNPYTIQPIGEITIPIMGSDVTILATVWSEKRDTAEGVRETISFSIPRGLTHSFMNLAPKSDAWYDAKDEYNTWRGVVLDGFLAWQSSKKSRSTVGGNVVRLVKRDEKPSK